MFEQSFKNIDDILHRDAGCATELDYIEQTSWILFLKYLDDLEKTKKTEALLSGKKYNSIIKPEYSWEIWAEPKKPDGKPDYNKMLTGDDLGEFVDNKLFPYFKKFKAKAENPNTIEYKIGEIFSELKNKIQSGFRLREILDIVDEMHFQTSQEKHELSHLYEAKIKKMGNAGRNGGEYYTPRPLIKVIVNIVAPIIGDKIYDGACGSAGFLVEAFKYLSSSKNLSSKDYIKLQEKTFYGKEIKSLAYIIGVMNMILHGIEAPNIIHTNTLATNINDIQEKNRYDIILANPPFGAGIGKEVQQNFPIKTGETAFLFLQHFIKILKAGGKAGIVIKKTFLSNTDNASISLRRHLLKSSNLHTILVLPNGVFAGTGEKTVVLFFEKGKQTEKIWYYQLSLERNLGKTNPLNKKDLEEFLKLQKIKTNSKNSWLLDISKINHDTFDLSIKNPNKISEIDFREPKEILLEMKKINNENELILKNIFTQINEKKSYLNSIFVNPRKNWTKKKLGEIIKLIYGKPLPKSKRINDGAHPVYGANGVIAWTDEYYYDKKSIIIGRKGSAGEINLTENKFWPLDVTYFVEFDNKKYSLGFLYYLLQSLKLPRLAKGVKPGINRNEIYLLNVQVPSLSEQVIIVEELDALSENTNKLEKIYNQKINDLNTLKKSILEKVFMQSI